MSRLPLLLLTTAALLGAGSHAIRLVPIPALPPGTPAPVQPLPDLPVLQPDPVRPTAPTPAPATAYAPRDPLYPRQWNLQAIHIPEAWTLTRGGPVTVAVLDTGFV